jgi:transcriptional regulator with PAS, ATPase and Fis domain
MDLVSIKKRFGIVGHNAALDRAIEIAVQVAITDLSVLITGESGVGKDNISKIIHQYSSYKHGEYIAVNCGAIPEGTIDSELFGHEKGAFTGATEMRKGYFEVANNGTIFLDEVADLPLPTQARLLRVLENGDFMRVGSSKVLRTKVRVIAATNVNLADRIAKGKFRADLYYRLNSVPIYVPALRERKEDIFLLFTKFASDFSEKYRVPPISLTPNAIELLQEYRWPGNVRELKNITKQISTLEKNRVIDEETLSKYLKKNTLSNLPMIIPSTSTDKNELFERELIYKFLIDMKREMTELKALVNQIIQDEDVNGKIGKTVAIPSTSIESESILHFDEKKSEDSELFEDSVVINEQFSLLDSEKELIKKALKKHNNRRKEAAKELGISERTLYRKIKELDL